ncbi:pentapeptide repeat-containing protein [Lachnospiraceae bacterium]|jgi:uncharacterized protein YjbI with pentapeptide repeats|nr:pentapeptide repeat-containing protein [Lachnospiraceae bacterium]
MDFSNNDLEKAINIYNEIRPKGKDVFGEKINLSDCDFDETYDTNRINKSSFTNCRFINTPFRGVSSAYSSYKNCLFRECETQNTNFTFCNFSSSYIHGSEKYTNWIANDFSYSMFDGAQIENTFFEGTAFYQASFNGAILNNLLFKHCCFDSALFVNSKVQNTDFSNIEMLLCNFENTEIINSKFTIIMLLNNFGLLQLYIDGSDIKVIAGQDSIMSKEDVLSKIKMMIPLFWSNHNFFSLCNIYLNLYSIDIAYKVLLECLEVAVKDFDFEQINHLCKLAVYSKKFPIEYLNCVYKFIDEKIDTSTLDYSNTKRYLRCNDEIKYLLQINPQQQPKLYLSLKTDINDTEEIGCLLKSIERTIKEMDNSINPLYNIQKHSPYEIILIICAAATTLLPIAQFFYYMNGGIKAGRDLCSSPQKDKSNKRSAKNDKNETRSKQEMVKRKKTFSFGKFEISYTTEEVRSLQLINDITCIIDGNDMGVPIDRMEKSKSNS